MEHNIKPICLHLSFQPDHSHSVLNKLPALCIIRKHYLDNFYDVMRNHEVFCILLSIVEVTDIIKNSILKLHNQFIEIPIIAILERNNMETARECGEMGIKGILTKDNSEEMEQLILEIAKKKQIRIGIHDFGITVNAPFPIVKQAIKIIEKNYITLMGTREIADILDVTDCTLIREFKKYEIISPKRLLLYFKVKHAMHLMHNKGLNLKEISRLSGFSDEKRFNECFHRVFKSSPSATREKLLRTNEEKCWKTIIQQ